MNQGNKKLFIVGVIAFTFATVSITSIYIPAVSKNSKSLKESPAEKTAQTNNYKGSRGSMWSNLDQKIKCDEEQRKK